jgi:AbrB family looped-hinge helix DNA binding protein
MTATIQIRSKGTIIIPAELRKKYKLQEGEVLYITDMGDGSFLLSPRRSRVDELADQLRIEMEARGESLETMLTSLREVRGKYGTKKP